MNKIEVQEQETLQTLSTKVHDLKYEIANIEVSMSRLKNKKTATLFEIEKAAAELQEFQASLHDKYGDVTINVKTGEYGTN